jgi:hypothetical protein
MRDFRRMAAQIHPVHVIKTASVTIKVIATARAMTVSAAAAMADGFP